MNFKKFAQQYAQEIDGDFRDYDEEQSVIVVPLSDERFQAVQGRIFNHPRYNREVVQLKSTVCLVIENIDFNALLAASADYVYSEFIIEEEFLRVESSAFASDVNEKALKEMIQEAANLADEWEFKITGKDVF